MEKEPLSCRLTLHLCAGENSFGPGVIELLERVDAERSLRKATASMNMAYSKAWKVLKNAEAVAGFPLLNATAGGRGGGGAVLTAEAQALLNSYRRLEAELAADAKEAFGRLFGPQA